MQTITIKINGMTCMGCVNSIKTALEKAPGVINVDISLDKAQAIIQYDAGISNEIQLKTSIEDAGFDVVS